MTRTTINRRTAQEPGRPALPAQRTAPTVSHTTAGRRPGVPRRPLLTRAVSAPFALVTGGVTEGGGTPRAVPFSGNREGAPSFDVRPVLDAALRQLGEVLDRRAAVAGGCPDVELWAAAKAVFEHSGSLLASSRDVRPGDVA